MLKRSRTTPESLVKKDVRRVCRMIGVLMYPIIGSPLQPPGLPDYWGCYRGKLVVVECKAHKGRLSPHQQARKQEIEAAGGLWITAYSGLDVMEALGLPVLVK